ncbi:MAG: response regulator [Pseudomonadota bacterium]
MAQSTAILLLEDEPLILMDLEFAAMDRGCSVHTANSCKRAIELLANGHFDVAILDVSLGGKSTCFPVAKRLEELGTPYLLHTGDLNRHDEHVRELKAKLIAKPSPANTVVAAALDLARESNRTDG